MKKIFITLLAVLISAAAFTGCSSSAKADYDSPKDVIKAHEAINTEWKNNQLYDDLKGKTFKVTANNTLDKTHPYGDTEKTKTTKKDSHNWVCIPYSDLETDVMLWLTNEEWDKIKYKKGDTLILQVDIIAQRGTKNGGIRQYYLNATMPE